MREHFRFAHVLRFRMAMQQRNRLFLAAEVDRLRGGEQRDLDARRAELGGGERLEARIEERGRLGVGLHVGEQLAVRLQRSDAAAQLAVAHERHESRADLVQEGVILARVEAHAQDIADRRTGDRDQDRARVLGSLLRCRR